MTTITATMTQIQGDRGSGVSGEPGRLRTIASSDAGGGSMRGTSIDSGEPSGGGGR